MFLIRKIDETEKKLNNVPGVLVEGEAKKKTVKKDLTFRCRIIILSSCTSTQSLVPNIKMTKKKIQKTLDHRNFIQLYSLVLTVG